MARDACGRPVFDEGLRALCASLNATNRNALHYLDPNRILFVAGAARRAARASIRPLTLGGVPPRYRCGDWEKPQVWFNGRLALYEVCLRPRYFLDATPEERIEILAHELWHISPAFDGTLAAGRRHRNRDAASSDMAGAWIETWRSAGAPGHEMLNYRGELRLSAWTERPPSRLGSTGRRRYSQDDLHSAVVIQR